MSRGREYVRKAGRTVGMVSAILLAGIVLGFLMLCLVHLLPVKRMHENVLASKDVINSHAQLVPGYESTQIDNYTDSIMLNEAICPVDAPLTDRVVNNYQVNFFRGYSQQENLLKYLEGEEGYDYQGYSHYWGGHQVFLKILLLLFDFSDILVMNVFLQALLMAFVVVSLYRTGRQYFVIPFCIAVLTMMPMAIALCLQYCDVFYIALLGSIAVIWGSKQIGTRRMHFLFLIFGMMTSYFDFLTYPLVSLGIPLVTALIYLEDEKVWKQVLEVIKNSVAWGVGYAGMWSGKWILGSILSPASGSLTEAVSSIRYRGSNMAQGMAVTTFDVLMKNLFVYLKWPVILLVGIAACVFLLAGVRHRNLTGRYLVGCIPYLLICLYPVAWYMVTKNHSFEHSFMAYRELAIATLAGLGMLSRLRRADMTGSLSGKQSRAREQEDIRT